ncbi:MAG: hypothetical protein WD824_22830 [Cyclobacteriaceae bacterium]
MTPEREKVYHEGLEQALDSGYWVLASGGRSLESSNCRYEGVRGFRPKEWFHLSAKMNSIPP